MKTTANPALKGVLVVLATVGYVGNAQAYDEDIHFHLNYYLARCAGFSQDDATFIASTAQYVDENANTSPSPDDLQSYLAFERRRRFHFPKHDSSSTPDTVEDSIHGRYNVVRATTKKDMMWFGVALHVLQDSYSHQGWGYVLGHAVDCHRPDRPYRQENWDRDLRMARNTYGRLREFYAALNGSTSPSECKWSAAEAFIAPLLQIKPATKFVDDPTGGVMEIVKKCASTEMTKAYADEIKERCGTWQAAIKQQEMGDVAFNLTTYEASHKTAYEAMLWRHCIPSIDITVAEQNPYQTAFPMTFKGENEADRQLRWLPHSASSLPALLSAFRNGTPNQQAIAAFALYDLGARGHHQATSALRARAAEAGWLRNAPRAAAYWSLRSLGLNRGETREEIAAHQQLLSGLVSQLQGRGDLLSAVGIALSAGNNAGPDALRQVIAGLGTADLSARWALGYALERLGRHELDLSPTGLVTIQRSAFQIFPALTPTR